MLHPNTSSFPHIKQSKVRLTENCFTLSACLVINQHQRGGEWKSKKAIKISLEWNFCISSPVYWRDAVTHIKTSSLEFFFCQQQKIIKQFHVIWLIKWAKGKVKFQQDSSQWVEALFRVKNTSSVLNIPEFHVIIWSDHEMIELILHFNNNYFVLPSWEFNLTNKVFMFWLWQRRGATTALRNNCNGIDHNCRIQWDHICNYKLQLSH